MADVEIAVRFRRKPRRHAAAMLPRRDVVLDDGADEIEGRRGRGGVIEIWAHVPMVILYDASSGRWTRSESSALRTHVSLGLARPPGRDLPGFSAGRPDDNGLHRPC